MKTQDPLESGPEQRLSSPAARRNREPLLAVLKRLLPPRAEVLEIASGSGEHALCFARALPECRFTPSDPSPRAIASIGAWRDLHVEAGAHNLAAPLTLDVSNTSWPLAPASLDAILCFNMIHIAPWQACLDLLAGSARHLKRNGALLLYGPFRRDGVHTSQSNQTFEDSLVARDTRWGIRDLEGEVVPAAQAAGLRLEEIIEMPANNLCVLLRRC